MRYIGQRVPRREDRDLITGRARRVADLTVPGTLELAFARSPVPHAGIRRVDVAAAREMPGVAGAWSAADLPGPPLAKDWIRYPGEALAVVAADTRAQAEDAAERVLLDLDPATAPPSGIAAEQEFGEPVDDVFTTAPVVVAAKYRQQLVLPTSLEPRAILVQPDLTVWVSHQAQHRLREALADWLDLDPARIRVIVPATGGAFGAKSQTYPEYVVAAFLALHLGRPVRWCEDRAEALLAATRGRGQYQAVRLAADTDGTFLAYELLVDADIGGDPDPGAGAPMTTGQMSPGAYRTPRVYSRVRSVLTPTPPTTAYRGAGRPEAAYAIERTVDQLARRLRMDPAELRRRNFVRPEQFPYRTPTGRTYDSGNYAAALDTALDAVEYDRVRAEQAQRRRDGGWPLGVGMATYVERSGGPPDSDEYGSVEACPDGTFIARSGSTSTGQGHRTVFAQVVASALGVELDRVRVVQGDTAEVPYGFGSYGSRSLQIGGSALWLAAKSVKARLDAGEMAPLLAEERYKPPQAFPFGAYAAVVEVDPDLGTVHVRRIVAVDDYGVVVNPMIVDGQGHGSIAQGLGQALYERASYGRDGMPVERTLLDYLLPTAADMPPITLLETQTPNPNTPLGAKGAGEAGCIGVPPAVVNAVCDALDVDHIDMPLTPEAVWRAIASRS